MVGSSALITATVSDSYVLPPNSSLSISMDVFNQHFQMQKVEDKTYTYTVGPLSGETAIIATTTLTTEPSALYGLDQAIILLSTKIQSADGMKKFWDEVAFSVLEFARAVVAIFQHASTQVLETDKLVLITN